MLEVVDSVDAWRVLRARIEGRTLGLVPTMGALHEGHVALFRRSVEENDMTVASVFVNPTQFDEAADLAAYPRTLESDRRAAAEAGVDFLFAPAADELYPDGYTYRVLETRVSTELCGPHRPGHFDGVLTIVLKLLGLVGPDVAYFGEKDYQQLQLIRGMAAAFFLDTEIRAVATVREPDGLALSSRNARLGQKQRTRAAEVPRILRESESPTAARAALGSAGFDVDYVEDRWERRFAAVRLEGVRLIDNVELDGAGLGDEEIDE